MLTSSPSLALPCLDVIEAAVAAYPNTHRHLDESALIKREYDAESG